MLEKASQLEKASRCESTCSLLKLCETTTYTQHNETIH